MTLSKSLTDREMAKFQSRRGQTAVTTSSVNGAFNVFDEMLMVERNTLFDVKASVPSLSQLRNILQTEGSGSAVVENGQVSLEANNVGDTVKLDTAQRGSYTPGHMSQIGIGVRLEENNYGEGDSCEWGYFQGSDGFLFGEDQYGLYIKILRAGTATIIRRDQWSNDKLDGTGKSGLTLTGGQGYIYQINYVWYGYGPIEFQILLKDDSVERGQSPITVHVFAPDDGVSVEQPNLYVRAKIENQSGNNLKMYIGGRQYTVFGQSTPIFRKTGAARFTQTVGTTFVPLISIRQRTDALVYEAQTVKLSSTSILTDSNLVFAFVLGGTLTGATFTAPDGYDVDETVVQSSINATAISDGIRVGPTRLVPAARGNASSLSEVTDFNFIFKQSLPVTLIARTISGNATVSSTMNVLEEW